MNILLWHVHGSWTTAFVQGGHTYLMPVLPDRGPDGLGRARTWDWPASVIECTPEQLRDQDIDLVVLQRPHESELVEKWTGRRPGRDVAAVYLEHNAPEPHPVNASHPLADQASIPIVHVTHFNELYWDCGSAPTCVIEHGVLDPGALYTGELARFAVVVNDPVRRGRMVGTDLLASFTVCGSMDVFGMNVSELVASTEHADSCYFDDLPQRAMHIELARRRVYLHPMRWTSLGLSLIEAMQLGMPVVALAATEAHDAVPAEAGLVSSDLTRLRAGLRRWLNEPEAARMAGAAGRRYALDRYGVTRFLAEWDKVIAEVAA